MPTLMKKALASVKSVIPSRLKSAISERLMSLLGKSDYSVDLGSFSQAGEDGVLRFLFKDYPLELSRVTYLDIGARHPVFGSNTFLFYCAGASGVCVDADASLIPLQRELRPRDTMLNVAITDSADTVGAFYFMEGGGSTCDKEEAERRASVGAAIVDVLSVPFVNINTLIRENFKTYPVLLSIDIEGLDLPVLKSLDFAAYPIPVICVETCTFSTTRVRAKDSTITDFLTTKGYEVYADTYVNTILVNTEWFRGDVQRRSTRTAGG